MLVVGPPQPPMTSYHGGGGGGIPGNMRQPTSSTKQCYNGDRCNKTNCTCVEQVFPSIYKCVDILFCDLVSVPKSRFPRSAACRYLHPGQPRAGNAGMMAQQFRAQSMGFLSQQTDIPAQPPFPGGGGGGGGMQLDTQGGRAAGIPGNMRQPTSSTKPCYNGDRCKKANCTYVRVTCAPVLNICMVCAPVLPLSSLLCSAATVFAHAQGFYTQGNSRPVQSSIRTCHHRSYRSQGTHRR